MRYQEDAEETDAVRLSALKDAISSLRPLRKLFGAKEEPVVWDESDEYDFTHAHRGTALIFNIVHIRDENDGLKEREGAGVDAERLKETFTHLGFDVCYKENQTKQQFNDLLKRERDRDHSQEDCFVCVILTHGGPLYLTADGWHKREDRVMAIDATMLIRDIVGPFHDRECKSLKGKPKLFFIQACRGDEFDRGVYMNVAHDEVDAKPTDSIEYTPCPIYKDFLIMYATPPGFYAFRHPETGSWFIQGLCKVLSGTGVRNQTLHQLLTAVIRVVSVEYQAKALEYLGYKQSPCFISMLVKDVYFRPKRK